MPRVHSACRRSLDQRPDLPLIDRCRWIVDDHLKVRPPVDREGRVFQRDRSLRRQKGFDLLEKEGATRFSAPRGSPAAIARAAAVISESI
jgi:hypothetical protein